MGNFSQFQHVAYNSSNSFTRTFNYISGTNRIDKIEIGSNVYQFNYDNNGNLTTENTERHFEWDHSDQMRCFYNQTGTSEPTVYTQYLYAGGTRLKKITRKSSGDKYITVYIDGIFEHSYHLDGSNTMGEELNELHILDDQTRVAMLRTGYDDGTPETKYILSDHLGSSNVILETDGSVYNREEYYPFGETSFGSFGKKRYRYVGKEKDEESGLYYYGARYFQPWSCRFISVDPLALRYNFQSSFVYADNNPICKMDHNGEGTTGDPNGGNKGQNAPVNNTKADNQISPEILKQLPQGPIAQGFKKELNGKTYVADGKGGWTIQTNNVTPKPDAAYPKVFLPAKPKPKPTLAQATQNASKAKPAAPAATTDVAKPLDPTQQATPPPDQGTIRATDPMAHLNEFERGMISSPVVKAVAVSVPATASITFVEGTLATRVISASADATSQLTSNEKIEDFNVTSTVANFIFPNSPFISAAVGNFGQVNIGNIQTGYYLENTVLGRKKFGDALTQTAIGGFGNYTGGKLGSTLRRKGLGGGGEFSGQFLGNSGSNITNLLKESYSEH